MPNCVFLLTGLIINPEDDIKLLALYWFKVCCHIFLYQCFINCLCV